jgi:predicted amidohydrolase
MHIRIAQLAVQRDLATNLARILDVLDRAQPGDMVVFPEGALSGYEPQDPAYLEGLDAAAIEHAIADVGRRVREVGCRCLVGSATHEDGQWWNSVLLLDERPEPRRYRKAELSRLDRHHFQPGPFSGDVWDAAGVPIGVLACRELLFPSIWMSLKQRGAQVVFHLNNAIQPHDALWLHLLVARAIEQSVFVCSVNNATAPQGLPSVLISPAGHVILQADVQTDQALAAQIDLAEVIADLTTRTDY